MFLNLNARAVINANGPAV